jgi:hypothetical protein
MPILNCDECHINIYTDYTSRLFDKTCHYIFCRCCKQKQKLIAKSKCQRLYLLKYPDIKDLKYLYLKNANNQSRIYCYKDIETIILAKYGSIIKLSEIIKQQDQQNKKKQLKKQTAIAKRKEQLITLFNDNKLEFLNAGDCYSYINYGTPPLETVLTNALLELQDKNTRRVKLAMELDKYKICFDENDLSCSQYINNNTDLGNTVDAITNPTKQLLIKFE